ncbi:MAG: tetratricopeptide repeat protein [Alphaproteobacteria bacterium]|nr:tetratricopeptide repeat protein [Alphaproteobacteria bacterium]
MVDARAHPALHGLGKILQVLGRYQEAAAALSCAIAIDPRNPDYLNDRGVALMESGAIAKALRDFDAALLLAPGFFGALLNKGLALKNSVMQPAHALHWTKRSTSILPIRPRIIIAPRSCWIFGMLHRPWQQQIALLR